MLADLLDRLADDVCRAVRIAHGVAPRAAEPGEDAAVARHVVLLHRPIDFVDTLAARGIVGAVRPTGDKRT